MLLKILGRVIFVVGIVWFMFLAIPLGNVAIWLALTVLIMVIGLTIEYKLPLYDPIWKKKKNTASTEGNE